MANLTLEEHCFGEGASLLHEKETLRKAVNIFIIISVWCGCKLCPSGHASTELQNIKFLQTFSSVFEVVRAAKYSRSCLSPDGRTEAESFRVRRRRRHRRRRRRRPCPRSPTLQTAAAGSALALGREGHRRLRSEGRRREREGGQRAVNATNIFIQQVRCWPRKRSQENSRYRK